MMLIHEHTQYRETTPPWLVKFDQGVRDTGWGLFWIPTILFFIANFAWACTEDADTPAFDPQFAYKICLIAGLILPTLLGSYLLARRMFVLRWFGSSTALKADAKYHALSPTNRAELKPVYTHVMREDRRRLRQKGDEEALARWNAFTTALDRVTEYEKKHRAIEDPVLARANRICEVYDEIERQDNLELANVST